MPVLGHPTPKPQTPQKFDFQTKYISNWDWRKKRKVRKKNESARNRDRCQKSWLPLDKGGAPKTNQQATPRLRGIGRGATMATEIGAGAIGTMARGRKTGIGRGETMATGIGAGAIGNMALSFQKNPSKKKIHLIKKWRISKNITTSKKTLLSSQKWKTATCLYFTKTSGSNSLTRKTQTDFTDFLHFGDYTELNWAMKLDWLKKIRNTTENTI